MQQHEVNAERQDLPNSGEMPARLGFLVRRFRAQIELRDRYDAELVAGLERVSRAPRVRQLIQQICEKELSRHG
jgi:hypothetical protein